MSLLDKFIPATPNLDTSSFKVYLKESSLKDAKKSLGKIVSSFVSSPLETLKGFINLSDFYSVSAITITRSVNKIPFAQLVISDGDVSKQNFTVSSSEVFVPGVEIKITMGHSQKEKVVFEGIIIKHNIQLRQGQPSCLMVELKDKAVKLTVGRNNKVFENKSDSDVISSILSANSFDGDVDSTDFESEEMVQYFCTDWDFILSRAEVNGLLVFVEDGKINVRKPKLDKDPSTSVVFGNNVYEFDADMDARDDFKDVVASSWDDSTRRILKKDAKKTKGLGSKASGALSLASKALSLVSPAAGSALSGVAGAEGTPSADELADVIGLKEFPLMHSGQLKGDELQAWADAKMSRSRLAKIKGRAKIDGDNSLMPGDMVAISRFSDRFDGLVFISSVTHYLSTDSAYYTELQFGFSQDWFSRKYNDINELPASGLLPAISGLQVGIVKKINDDPNKDYRIKVQLPMISDGNEGVWARLATLDAGKERGSFFIPEVDDEVIVGFMNDDPRNPVILGMLYSSNSNGKPPVEPTATNYKKGFYTKSKIKLEFDDQKQSVRIKTPNGNEVLISDKDGSGETATIVLSDKNKNKIEMSDKGITIESGKDLIIKAQKDIKVDGGNITTSATQKLTTKGNGGVEMTSSSNTVIKGSVVQIN